MSWDAWWGKDVLSILDYSRRDVDQILNLADYYIDKPKFVSKTLTDKIVTTAFFEPSTRTRLSFSAAALKLGAKVLDLSPDVSSVLKGESLPDTIRMLDGYSDLIVMRHPSEGAALLASEVATVPIINGGDGSQHHPTQALLDLFTVRRLRGTVEGLTYAVMGDIRYARSATSFLYGLSRYGPGAVYLVAPESLQPRNEVKSKLKEIGLKTEEFQDIEKVLKDVDVIYLTRIQKERFPDPNEYEKVKGSYRVTKSTLTNAKAGSIILHALPRTNELAYDVDTMPNAAYMKQARFGVPVRMALLNKVLGAPSKK